MQPPGFARWCLVLAALVVVVIAALAGNDQGPLADAALSDQALDGTARVRLEAAFGHLPLHFEAHTKRGEFLSHGRGYTLVLKPSEAVLAFQASAAEPQTYPDAGQTPRVTRLRLLGAATNPPMEAVDPLPGKINYFIGSDPRRWRTDVTTYSRVRYRAVYPGIDLLYYGNQTSLEFDFVVAPGGDTQAIRLAFEGVDEARIDARGDLLLGAEGKLRMRAPSIYQESGGVRQGVIGRYVLRRSEATGLEPVEVAFSVEDYDFARPLIIDPVLEYSTYFGWAGGETGKDVTVDVDGNVYLTGSTTLGDPAVTLLGSGGSGDVFVAKVDPTGPSLVLDYVTIFGGAGSDAPSGITLVDTDSAVVGGNTTSTDFPVTNGAFSKFNSGATDGFVAKLGPDGSVLSYATYLGGSAQDVVADIVRGGANIVYAAGNTGSVDFPVKEEFQSALDGLTDAFVAKLELDDANPVQPCTLPYPQNDCDDVLASTYLGGGSFDAARGVAAGFMSVVLTGQTCSNDFPTTFDALDQSLLGACDAFVTELALPSISPLRYSTYLGGTGQDLGSGIARSGPGFLITGETASTDFPVTGGAFSTHAGGVYDAFVVQLVDSPDIDACTIAGLAHSNCADLVWSTYLGGADDDYGRGVAADPAGAAYVTGQTCSADFPTLEPLPQNAGQGVNVGGGCDAFVSKFTPPGSALAYSTYLGGSASDSGNGLFVDSLGNAHVAGGTSSGDFPEQVPLQAAAGGAEAFVAKLTVPCVNGGGPFAYLLPAVIDTSGDCVVESIPGTSGMALAVSPASGTAGHAAEVYTADFDALYFVDPATAQVDALAMPAGITAPQGLAVSPDGTRLYLTDHCDAVPCYVHVFDAQTQQFLESIAFGANDASMSQAGAGIVVHPSGEKLYLTSNHGDVDAFVIDLTTKQSSPIPLDGVNNKFQRWDIAVTPDGRWVYVANGHPMNDSVSVIDTSTDSWVKTIDNIDDAKYLAITPQQVPGFDYLVYVTAATTDDLTVIDTTDHTIVHTEPGAGGTVAAVTPDATTLYVTPAFGAGVKVIDVSTDEWIDSVLAVAGSFELARFMGPQDRDADGINDEVDADPSAFSNDFTDGTSSGSIVARADQTVAVWDAFENGLFASARGGTQTAHIQACGLDVLLDQNDAVKVLCGSLTLKVFRGPAEVGIGPGTFASVPTGAELQVSEVPPGEFLLQNLGLVTVDVTNGHGDVLASIGPLESLTWTNPFGNKCRRATAKEASKFVRAKAKALQTCEAQKVKGQHTDPCPCPGCAAGTPAKKADEKIAKASSKLSAKIAKTCGGDNKVCGDFDPGEDPPATLGFFATCPDFESSGTPSCTAPVADCGDLAACVECIAEEAVDQAMALYYADMMPSTLGSPLNKCQQTIGRETTKFLLAKEKAIRKCWDKRYQGKGPGSGNDKVGSSVCPDLGGTPTLAAQKAALKILKAESKKVVKICKQCGGPSKTCDLDLDTSLVVPGGVTVAGVLALDDTPPSSIGFMASCPDVTIPGGTNCSTLDDIDVPVDSVNTLRELVLCIDCVTEFKVDCIDAAARPHFRRYPSECNP